MYPPGDKKTPTWLAGTSAFSFLHVLRRDASSIRSLWLRESDMMLNESMNQDQAYQGTITARKPPRTKVRPIGAGSRTTKRRRPAIHGFPAAGPP